MDYLTYLQKLDALKRRASKIGPEEYWAEKEQIETQYRSQEEAPVMAIDCPHLSDEEVNEQRNVFRCFHRVWTWVSQTLSTNHRS